MVEKLQHVDEHLLEFDGDALTYNGELFTGVSILNYPSGRPREELSYYEGFPRGMCRVWHHNGTLLREWLAVQGQAPDLLSEWFDSGELKSKKVSECGVELEYTEWNVNGELILSRKLEEGSSMHTFLERMRKLKS